MDLGFWINRKLLFYAPEYFKYSTDNFHLRILQRLSVFHTALLCAHRCFTKFSGDWKLYSHFQQYQSSGAGGTRSPPATPRHLQHLTASLIQHGRRGLVIGQTLCYWTLQSLDKFFWFDHSFYENLKNPKWPPGGPKMADGVWKGVYP